MLLLADVNEYSFTYAASNIWLERRKNVYIFINITGDII